ncbi:MAG: DUF4265 domain-containing protein [Planctomycetes bacterium]|nr:DUF4265 domain-containing protein [Planctomycetota bacterium]
MPLHAHGPDVRHLSFPLQVRDGWPPVGAECLPFGLDDDGFRLLDAPLFVPGLSVDDVIQFQVDAGTNVVTEWRHVRKSGHSTFWLLRMGDHEVLADALVRMRALGCSTVSAAELGVFAVDVPESLPLDSVGAILDELEAKGVPVACPSLRHPQ